MFRILVASAKGGVGKTTISTTLAGYYALKGHRTVLLDADPQGSSLMWCAKRNAETHSVLGMDGTRRQAINNIPDKAQRVIIDTPAGAMPEDLSEFIDVADALIIPALPSVMDSEATKRFLLPLLEHKRVARKHLPIGIVANRLKPRTQSTQHLISELSHWPVEVIGQLRDTQAYVLLAGLGKCVFDYHSENIRDHQEDWKPIRHWLKQVRKKR